jgi:hypothetical protein
MTILLDSNMKTIFKKPTMHLRARTALFAAFLLSLGGLAPVQTACSSTEASTPTTGTTRPDASTEGPAEDGGDVGDGGTFVEKALTIDVALAVSVSAPAGSVAAGADAGVGAGLTDGGTLADAGTSTETASEDIGSALVAKLTITARDGTTPVITDLWLYTLDGTPSGGQPSHDREPRSPPGRTTGSAKTSDAIRVDVQGPLPRRGRVAASVPSLVPASCVEASAVAASACGVPPASWIPAS